MANADRIIDLLHEAKARPAGAEREQFLDEACRDDVALKEQIISLLEAEAGDNGTFLRITQILRPTILPTEKPGDRIGRYKLLEQIGEGGCGVVYMAEQEQPVRRRVALKVIKLGMDTKQVIARFEAERQALAMMDHPNIAKVLDGGATDTGRPFFVMELVRGIKITDYCDQNNLSTNERLGLFIQVCQAIQHAHQKGIIHRDIKPSNILVTQHDDVAVPKVIDFGIAKATTGQLTDKTVFTAFAQFIGTPAYMSPEQAQMSGLDIDTRADIYSLGVLLYELLTGNTPFDAKELLAAGMDEMRRKIREDEPVKPSTCLSTMQAMDLTTVAKRRHVEPPKLIHLIRGDLDWLVMKCLEKDRTRRYETANGLAMDIQRHLNSEPVGARPPSRWYEFQKTVRRHKVGFAATAAVIVALGLGALVSTLEAIRATRAQREQSRLRQKSETEAAKATAISDFLQQSLRSANPDELKGSEYTVRQLLDDFSAGLESQFKDQPEVEAAVRATLGQTYYRLGLADKSQVQMERALVLRRRIFGEREQVAATLVDYAWTSFEQRQLTKGESQAREALDIYRKRGTVGQPVIAALWVLQEILYLQGRFTEVESVTEEAMEIARETPAIEYRETASVIHGLAQAKLSQSKFAEAEVLCRKAVEMHRRLHGAQHPETGWALVALGRSLREQKKLDEAERVCREALAIFRKQYFFGHKSLDAATEQLRAVLEAKGDSAELVALYRNTLAEQRAALGPDNPMVAETLMNLSDALKSQGNQAEAENASREALNISLKGNGPITAKLPAVVQRQAEALKSRDKVKEAERLFENSITVVQRRLGDTNVLLGELLHNYGEFLQHEGKFEAAAEYHLKSLPIRRAQPDDNLAWTLRNLGGELVLIGKPQESERYLRESLALYRKLHKEEDINGTVWTTERLGYALYQQHKLPEAEQAYREALAGCATCQAVGSGERAVVVRSLLDVLKAENKLAEGETLCREILAQQRAAFTNNGPAVAEALVGLADNLVSQGKQAEAEPLFREAIALYEKAITSFPSNAELRGHFVELLRGQGKLAEAGPVLREALERQRKLAGSENLDVAAALTELSFLLREQGKLPDAETTAREALAMRKKLLGNEHTEVAQALHLLAWNLNLEGKNAEAESLSREELDIRRKLLGNDDVEVGATLGDLAFFLRDQGKLDELDAVAREAIAIYEKLAAKDPPRSDLLENVGHNQWHLAMALDVNGKRELAQRTLQNSLSLFEKGGRVFPQNPYFRQEQAFSHRLLGDSAIKLGNIDDAERHYHLAINLYSGLKTGVPQNVFYHQEEAYATWMLAQILDRADRPELSFAEYRGSLSLHEQAVVVFPADAVLKSRRDSVRADFSSMLRRRVPIFEAAGQSKKAAEWKKQLAEIDNAEAGKQTAVP